MAIQQVFIIWSHPLSYESMRLLLNHPEVEIVGATADYANAQEEITRLKPDTIIFEETEDGARTVALAILESSHWVRRIIGFSLDDNQLIIYRREERTVMRAEDLLSLIRSG
jgi:AmiR/NasT family two-component response regulator